MQFTKTVILFITFTLYSMTCQGQTPAVCNGKAILGNVEQVLLLDTHKIVEAKIDSGSMTSSLSADNIKEVKRNNKTWIEFDLLLSNSKKKLRWSAPLAGYSKITLRSEEVLHNKKYGIRPIILMNICISHTHKRIAVNLIDRSQFKYPMLIGTEALNQLNVVIDTTKKFMTTPAC